MAAPLLVPIAYGLVRGLISRYGSKQGVRMLMRELKVNQNTASKILDTYKKVDKKGKETKEKIPKYMQLLNEAKKKYEGKLKTSSDWDTEYWK